MKANLILTTAIGMLACSSQAQLSYSQNFTLTDPFGMSPASVQNAFLRTEAFGSPVRYWQPSAANVWGEVTYRFDIPFTINTASMFMSASAFLGFDGGAQSYVDVSTNNIDYSTVLFAGPAYGGGEAGPGDISSLVAGSDVVFVRSRLLMTQDFGSFSSAQFLRGDPGATFGLSAIAIPEPSAAVLLGMMVICLVSAHSYAHNRSCARFP